MAHFLFPASTSVDKGKRKDDYPPLLADIVRGATDCIDALSLFRDLVVSHGKAPDTPGFMAFDAHVGETGCHLRAGMVNEVFATYRRLHQHDLGAWRLVENWLDETISRLEGVVTQARAACVKLTQKKVKPSQLGFNQKQETPRKILHLLGWSEPEHFFHSTAKGEKTTARPFEPLTSSSSTSSLENEKGEKSWLGPTAWDVLSSTVLARFLVYAYVLSKYKAFSFYNGSPNGSLQPQVADSFTRKLMRDSWDTNSASVKRPGLKRLDNEFRDLQICLSELSCAWLQSLAKRSHLRCDMSSLVASTIQRSKLGLAAAACFPGYLLQREFLFRQSIPLILVDKHFCTHGYHVNVFEASITSPAPKSRVSGVLTQLQNLFKCILPTRRISNGSDNSSVDDGDTHRQTPLLPSLRWRIKRTSIKALMAAGSDDDATTPHMVVTGNSLRGTHPQYADLVRESLTADPGSRPPNSFPHVGTKKGGSKGSSAAAAAAACRCADNDAHVAEFLRADHDRVALSFFAVHCAYSFPLAPSSSSSSSGKGKGEGGGTDDNDEVAVVEGAMDAWAAEKPQARSGVPSPAGLWRASRDDADRVGTGAGSMHLFRWQHAFAESRARLGWLLERSLGDADLMPLKAVLPGLEEGGV